MALNLVRMGHPFECPQAADVQKRIPVIRHILLNRMSAKQMSKKDFDAIALGERTAKSDPLTEAVHKAVWLPPERAQSRGVPVL